MPPSKRTVEFDLLLESTEAARQEAESAFDQRPFFQEMQERAYREALQTWEDEGGASTHAAKDESLVPVHRSLSRSIKEADAMS